MNLSKFDLQFKERTRFKIFFLMIPIFHDSGYRVNSLNNQRLAKRSTILQQIYILRNEAYIYVVVNFLSQVIFLFRLSQLH